MILYPRRLKNRATLVVPENRSQNVSPATPWASRIEPMVSTRFCLLPMYLIFDVVCNDDLSARA